jgi:hypothetical protein
MSGIYSSRGELLKNLYLLTVGFRDEGDRFSLNDDEDCLEATVFKGIMLKEAVIRSRASSQSYSQQLG